MNQSDKMFPRFAAYGFLKNLRFFEPFLILIFRAAGLSFFQIGLLYSIRDLTNNIMEVPTGVLADVFGRRRAMVSAFAAYIVSLVIFYAFNRFALYAVGMVLFGLGEAFRSGTHKALILEYLRLNGRLQEKVSYYGRTRGFSQLGSAVNALLAAGLVFFTGDYRLMFLVTILPYALDLLNLATYPRVLDGELAQLDHGVIWRQTRRTFSDFSGIFKHGNAMRALLNSAGLTALFKATKDYLQPILESFALSLPVLLWLEDVQRSGLVVGVVYFFIYLMTSQASRSADSFSRRFRDLATAINITFLIGAAFIFLAGLAAWRDATLPAILVFIGFYGLQNLRKPMNVAYISDQIPARVMASGLSVEAQISTILVAVFAPLLGLMADHWGVGLALASLGGLACVLFLLARLSPSPALTEG